MHHQIDAGSHGRHHEGAGNVGSGQQRQRRDLGDGVVRTVGVDRAHARQDLNSGRSACPGFRLPGPRRQSAGPAASAGPPSPVAAAGISPDPSRFGCRHCRPTTSRSGSCSSKISSTVTTRLPRTYRCCQTVQQCCFAGLRGPGDQDVEASGYRCGQKSRCLGRQRPEFHEVLQPAGPDDELP